MLPRLSDVVPDLRELAATNRDEAFLLGTGVSEAFYQVPLHESERQFTVAAFAGKYYLCKVLVFGSSSAPAVWGRYAAFLGRSTAAVRSGNGSAPPSSLRGRPPLRLLR